MRHRAARRAVRKPKVNLAKPKTTPKGTINKPKIAPSGKVVNGLASAALGIKPKRKKTT